jgi:hypothetical protein
MTGPDCYKLSLDGGKFTVTCSSGTPKFSGLATSKLPKLYIVCVEGQPVYIGITRQSMRTRLRGGFAATGKHGYHGYAWRSTCKEATLNIWCHEDAPTGSADRDIETVEAEVVFLARLAGEWPAGQTEIHFHPSTQVHRDVAATIWRTATQVKDGKMDRRIVVLGVSHRLQGSPNYPNGVNDPGYSDTLRAIISEGFIDFIFEEASGCGLTTAARLIESLKSIRYLDIDPHLSLRHEFGIVNDSGQSFPLGDISDEERVAEDAKREEFWCKRIAEHDFKSGLVICGYLHTLSVTFRLRSAGFGVRFDQYIPHDKLCSHVNLGW